MPDRMQALHGKVAGVIAALAATFGPVDKRRAPAVANLLGLLVEQLLGHFFPRESQIAFHGDEAQSDAAARG